MATRNVKATLMNFTGAILHKVGTELENSTWKVAPPETIDDKASANWETQLDDSSDDSNGNKGWVEYQTTDNEKTFRFTWDNPQTGTCKFGTSAPKGFSSGQGGHSGENSTVSFSAVSILSKPICYRKLRKYKYQTLNTFTCPTDIKPPNDNDIVTNFISLKTNGQLTIQSGYAWDGPSGPTIDTKTFMRGSLVHDALYQLMREKHLTLENRNKADELLKKICIEDGMNGFRAWYVYKAVHWCAEKNAKPPKKDQIQVICAP